MRRHGTVSRKPSKTQHRKPTRPKRGNAPTTARQGSSSQLADLQELLKRQALELEEARDERAALAEVLRVISSSPGELEPVFRAMLENATRICEAKFGLLNLDDMTGSSRVVAMHNVPKGLAELRQREPVIRHGPSHPLGRVAATKRALHIIDLKTDAATRDRDAQTLRPP